MSRETEDLVREVLAKTGHTKVTLSNLLGIPWEDVDAWANGAAEPSSGERDRLRQMLGTP